MMFGIPSHWPTTLSLAYWSGARWGHDDIDVLVDEIVPAFAALKGLHPFHITDGAVGDDDGIWIGAENLPGQLGDPWLLGSVCSGTRINKQGNFDQVDQ